MLKLYQAVDITYYLVPAAFGRLCVETLVATSALLSLLPAAFGRLCVETICASTTNSLPVPSRLRAAVC